MPDDTPTCLLFAGPATKDPPICVGTYGLMDNPWCPDAMQIGYAYITVTELLRRRLALLSTAAGVLQRPQPTRKLEMPVAPGTCEKRETEISLLVQEASLSLATLSVIAEPGKRTGVFYTLLSNLPLKTQAKDLLCYYQENGAKVATAEITSGFTGWVVVIGFKTHVRVQKITQLVSFRSKALIADGSNAVMSKRIMTFNEATQKRVAKTNAAARYHDDPGVYDPTCTAPAQQTHHWNGSSCLHYNTLYQPLALDPVVHATLIENLSTMLAMPPDRFPPIRQLPDLSAAPSLAYASGGSGAGKATAASTPPPVFTVYMYFHANAGKSHPCFQTQPPADALAGVTALHPVEVTRLRTGCKLPSLCSAIVDKMGKADALPELYAVAMRFSADGISAAEATVIFKTPRAALNSAKKFHKCSVEGIHVVAKTGTPFYVV